MTPTRAPRTPASIRRVAALATVLATALTAVPAALAGQWDAPVQPHRIPLEWGDVILDAMLHFRFADRYLGGPDFSELLTADDAATLFDPEARLASALDALGASSPALSVGGTTASVQASQTRLPLTLRAGLPWGLELEGTAVFVRTRLEAEARLLPAADGTLGRSPALDDPTAVQTFVDEVVAATEGFSAGGRDWAAWGEAWRAAYRASVLFPTSGSGAATQLLEELDSLNAALVADGRAPVSAAPLFAPEALTPDGFATLGAGAPYGLVPLDAAPYVWSNGDVDVVLHYGLLGRARADADPESVPESAPDSTRESSDGHGLRLSGGIRVPVARQADPDLPFSTAAGNGVFATLAGAEGWVESGPWSLAGSVRTVLNGSRDVVRRIGPVDRVFIGRDSRVGLSWTPGTRTVAHVRAGFRPAGPLRLELGYTLDRRGEDDYELLGAAPGLDGNTAFPTPLLYADPTLLAAGTGGTVHWLRGGFRWVPRERGAFGVSLDVGAPISGELARAYEWTELRLRLYRAVRLGALFD